MIPQLGNTMLTMMLAKFMLNDLPHVTGLLDGTWENRGLAELSTFLRQHPHGVDFGPYYIDEMFDKLAPSVGPTVKTYVVGYYLIANDQHSTTIVNDTYRATKRIWRAFKGWLATSKLEEEAGEELAAFIREETGPMIAEIDKGILLTDASGSKVLFLDTFSAHEHLNKSLVVKAYVKMSQELPDYFDLALMNYYYTLIGDN